jgi:transcriptional regulator with XRE-family HTH domain
MRQHPRNYLIHPGRRHRGQKGINCRIDKVGLLSGSSGNPKRFFPWGEWKYCNNVCFASATGGERKGLLMAGIGARLRAIRRHWQLSLREVEQRSLRFAQERGSQSYQISASWLDRLEREEHELTVNKLIALASIYNLPTEQLLRSMHPSNEPALNLKQLSSPNATILLTEGPLEAQARYLLPDLPFPDLLPDETSLLATENGQSLAPHRRGIIGKHDLTLDPMIPAGSIVQIDTQKRAISLRKDWTP